MSELNRITCREAQLHLTQIKFLERELQERVVSAQAEKITEKERKELSKEARRVKLILEAEIVSLQEKVNPFERLFNLKEQYRNQIYVLETARILETREINGEKVKGITDIEGEFQPIPTRREVIERLFEKKELLETKKNQGFGKIRLVPFGMSLENLAEKHKQVLREKAKAGKLFTARKERNDPNEVQVPLEINLADPIFLLDEYKNADKNGILVYHPRAFTRRKHGGCTKREILKERREKHKSGWDILLFENDVNIPQLGAGKNIGGRFQIETNNSPEQYLEILQAPQCEGETGLTPEDILIHAMSELIENNEVIDDEGGNGNACYITGAYFPTKGEGGCGSVPYHYFNSIDPQVWLSTVEPADWGEFRGARFGVRV